METWTTFESIIYVAIAVFVIMFLPTIIASNVMNAKHNNSLNKWTRDRLSK